MINKPACKLLSDCLNCTLDEKGVFYQLNLVKGYNFQQYRHKQIELLFILSGKVHLSGIYFSDMVISGGQIISFPGNMEIDITILEDTNCLIYVWGNEDFLCEEQYKIVMGKLPYDMRCQSISIIPPLKYFIDSVLLNLESGISCKHYWKLKEQELMLLMNNYYPIKDLVNFLTPILHSFNHFRMFVQNNYHRVRTVQELAQMGGYGLVNFRRLFINEYGEPAHQWMSRQKQEHIKYDLTNRNLTISEISYKYQFESLSQFSNYCKKYFNMTPREIVKEANGKRSVKVEDSIKK